MRKFTIARSVSLAAATCFWLSACGGSAGSGGAGETGEVIPPSQTADGRILAGTAEIETADFRGRSFPLVFAVAEGGAPEARTRTGVGTVTVVNDDTLLVSIPGQDPRRFARTSGNAFADASGLAAELQDFGPARHLFVETPAFGLSAAYGFETPVAARPLQATYNTRSASILVLAIPGRETFLEVGGAGTVDLLAAFSGSGGTISGRLLDTTLIEGDPTLVDLFGTGTAQDELIARAELDAVITEGGLAGTFRATASARLGSDPDVVHDLGLVLAAPEASGRFFGTAAQAVAGSYAADAQFTLPGGAPQTGRITGFFIAE